MRNTRAPWWGLAALVLTVAGLLLLRLRGGDEAPPTPSPAVVSPGDRAETPRPPPPPAQAPAPAAPLRLVPATSTADAAARSGAFEGRVVSAATGEGVAGAELTFASRAGAVSVHTGAEGAFRFVPDAPGAYQLAVVTAKGFVPFGPEWGQSPIHLTAAPGRRIGGIVLALEPLVELRGRVVGPDGAPVAGAQVRLRTRRAGDTALFPAREHLVADARGEFRFEAVGVTAVEAYHPDFAPGVAEVLLNAGEVVVRLGRREGPAPVATAVLAGRVVDGTGAAVAGAAVRASTPLSAPVAVGQPPLPEALTDEEGRFRLEGLAPGTYDVAAWRAELAPARLADVAAGREDLVLTLREGLRLEGVVRTTTGSPIPSFTLSVLQRVGPLRRTGYAEQAVMDAEGRYVLRGLLPGSYAVQVAAHGYAPAERLLEVAADERGPLRADFTLSEGARLSGQVVEAGTARPLERASIQVEGGLGGGALAVRFDALTDARGEFTLSGLAPGEVSLNVSADGHHRRVLSGIAVREGTPAFQRVELRPVKEGETPQVELVGIGAVLSAHEDALVLGQVVPGGGAAEAGLAPGDAIVRIDGTPVVDLGFPTAIQRIRGPENSRLVLGVRRAGSSEVAEVPVTRRRIQL